MQHANPESLSGFWTQVQALNRWASESEWVVRQSVQLVHSFGQTGCQAVTHSLNSNHGKLNHLKPFHSARLRFSFSFGRVAVNLK